MNVLIVGKNSYIGSNVRDHLSALGHSVTEFDVQNETVADSVFEGVDSVIHVAAIVHRKDVTDYSLYEEVNVHLPRRVAYMAKKNGVKQFVFLSSMAVYGGGKSLTGHVIGESAVCMPNSMYGRSKLEAERALSSLEDDLFKIAFVRPANVYGKGCPGGYMTTFRKIVERLPLIPLAYEGVKQGMVYIGNLCELIRLIVENIAGGVFPAQDDGGVSSVDLMEAICKAKNMKKKKSKTFGLPFRIIRIGAVNKLFGGVVYDDSYACTELGDYRIYSFEQGIKETFGE